MKRTLSKLAIATVMAVGAVAAQANPLGLALVLDESGSITSADWTLQQTGYANVLGSSLIKTDGSLVIGVWKFAQGVEQVFAPTLISGASDKTALVSAINAMSRTNTGATAIGDAITTAAGGFGSYASGLGGSLSTVLAKMVIDVSTDGGWNHGVAPSTAVANVAASGVDQVNCLGIGPSADCTWNRASDLDFAAASFADFETILKTKIAIETGQAPEPASLALVGLALAGLAGSRRRSAKAV